MKHNRRNIPPIGVPLSQDIAIRGNRVRARIRWTEPLIRKRRSHSITVDNLEEAQAFFALMESRTCLTPDPLTTLADYSRQVEHRYLRGLDPTSTARGYRGGLKLRVLPTLGHLPVRDITTGSIDRAIDGWERACSPLDPQEHHRSTVESPR